MNKEKLYYDVDEGISNMSGLLEKIDVMLEDVSFDLYEKINLDTKRHIIDLENVVRLVQIKHSILCEYTKELRGIFKKLSEDFDAINSKEKSVNCTPERP